MLTIRDYGYSFVRRDDHILEKLVVEVMADGREKLVMARGFGRPETAFPGQGVSTKIMTNNEPTHFVDNFPSRIDRTIPQYHPHGELH
jgi:hypothetical protein